MHRLSKFIKYIFYGVFFFTPLLFTYQNSELFELPKMYFVYTATSIIITLHLINVLNNQTPLFRKSILNIPLLLFFISQLISTIISVDPHTSLFGYYSRLNGGLFSLICYLILFFTFNVYFDEKSKDKFILISLLSGTGVALFGIAEHFGVDKHLWVQDVQSRVFSTLGQPNWLAAYLCILLPFSLQKVVDYFFKNKKYLSILFSLQFFIFYVCLLFTKSKSGIIAAIISLGLFFLLSTYKSVKSKNIKLNLTILLPLFFILGLFSIFLNNPIKDRIFPAKSLPPSIVSPDQIPLNITPSEDIRKIVWKGAIDLWKRYPVFGTGTETFAYTYYWTRPTEHNLTSEWDFLYNKAHNEYINYLATTGALGLATYLLIIAVTIFLCVKKSEFAVLAAFTSILITNIAGFTVVVVSLFFFVLPSLMLVNKDIKENSDTKNKNSIIRKLALILVIFSGLFLLQKNMFFYLGDITYAQAQSADSKQDYQSAYSLIKSSIVYNPSEPLYYDQASLSAAKMALVATSQKDSIATQKYIDEAIAFSNKSIEISPSNTNIWKERAQVYYYLATIDTKYFQESVNSLTKVTMLAPTDAKTYYLLGQFLSSAGLNDQATIDYKKAISLKPNYDYAYFALGSIQYDQKNYSDAAVNFEAALKINPKNTEAKSYLDKIKKVK